MITNVIRTQIQLTPRQAQALKELAAEKKVSMAELIRRGVDGILERSGSLDRGAIRSDLRGVFGSFSSGSGDLGVLHDDYLVDAIVAGGELSSDPESEA